MSDFTTESRQRLEAYLATHHIPVGIGTEEEACSIAAINLAINGELIDDIPDCMSEVIGKWIITIQDVMPDEMRNSREWKSLLPLAAGTGREREKERMQIVLGWMWEILSQLQFIANRHGFGNEWQQMAEKKTADAAARTVDAAYAARAAADVAVDVAVDAAVDAADVAAYAARAVDAEFWGKVNPCGLLNKLVNL